MTETPEQRAHASVPSDAEVQSLMVSHVEAFQLTDERLENLIIALNALRTDDPSAIPLAMKLMSSGGSHARRMTAESFYLLLNSAATTISMVELLPNNYPDGWQATCVWGEAIPSRLVSLWSMGKVMDDINLVFDTDDSEEGFVDEMYWAHEEIFGFDSSMTYATDLNYWRGMSVLTLTKQPDLVNDAEPQVLMNFAQWAGTLDYPSAAIELVKKRSSLDVDMLTSIMGQAAFNTPLADGVL